MIQIELPSVQSLLIQLRFQGTVLGTGTGFIAKTSVGPALFTNRHNVTGRNNDTGELISGTGGIPDEVLINHNKKGQLGAWVARCEPLYESGRPLWREHPTLKSKADFVMVPLTQVDDVEFFPYELSDPSPRVSVRTADVVSVVGFPFGLTAGGFAAIWATGFVASEPGINYNNLPILLIDCRSRQGQSGSAVIAYRNGRGVVSFEDGNDVHGGGPQTRLIGIYSGRINNESDLGIVWKASALYELAFQ